MEESVFNELNKMAQEEFGIKIKKAKGKNYSFEELFGIEIRCPHNLTKYETESENFWKYCYNCPHCIETDSGLDMLTCEVIKK